MRLTYTFPIILAFVSSYIEAKPGAIDSVNIIKKLTQDLESSPSGYTLHHYSDNVHPGGYNADVFHGKTKIGGQLEMEKLAEMNDHGKIGAYKVAGGYGFTISHDYGSQKSHSAAPHAVTYSTGASNDDLASIAVLELRSNESGGPSIDVSRKMESLDTGKSEGLDSYVGKELHGSSIEYDKLAKDGKKVPSIYPAGEYYESTDIYDGKEKYDLDDGSSESNKGGDERRYIESKKYYGSQDYNENEDQDAFGKHDDHIDNGETDKYITLGEYANGLEDFNDEKRLGVDEEYGDNGNYESYKTNGQLTNRDEYYNEAPSKYVDFDGYDTEPKYGDMRSSFLEDFFKEYNEFSKGAHIQAGFGNDHDYNDDYYGDHDTKDEHWQYDENSKSGEDFFDKSDSHGDHHEEAEGEKNSNFGDQSGHKKGSKTTGYRNVLHKDEYTKDHKFYEHAKNDGHFNKDGDSNEHDYQNEGSHEKEGHHDSGSNDDHHGQSDSEDKGYFFGDDLSHNDEHGYKSHFDDHSDYANGGDSRYESEYEGSYDEPNH